MYPLIGQPLTIEIIPEAFRGVVVSYAEALVFLLNTNYQNAIPELFESTAVGTIGVVFRVKVRICTIPTFRGGGGKVIFTIKEVGKMRIGLHISHLYMKRHIHPSSI